MTARPVWSTKLNGPPRETPCASWTPAAPPPAEGTAEAAARVAAAREAQTARAAEGEPPLNARLEGDALERHARPDEPGRALLAKAAEVGGLTARGWDRVLRLALTAADLAGRDVPRTGDLATALALRSPEAA